MEGALKPPKTRSVHNNPHVWEEPPGDTSGHRPIPVVVCCFLSFFGEKPKNHCTDLGGFSLSLLFFGSWSFPADSSCKFSQSGFHQAARSSLSQLAEESSRQVAGAVASTRRRCRARGRLGGRTPCLATGRQKTTCQVTELIATVGSTTRLLVEVKRFRYLKWSYKLYGYGLCKGKPCPKNSFIRFSTTIRYLKVLVMVDVKHYVYLVP